MKNFWAVCHDNALGLKSEFQAQPTALTTPPGAVRTSPDCGLEYAKGKVSLRRSLTCRAEAISYLHTLLFGLPIVEQAHFCRSSGDDGHLACYNLTRLLVWRLTTAPEGIRNFGAVCLDHALGLKSEFQAQPTALTTTPGGVVVRDEHSLVGLQWPF